MSCRSRSDERCRRVKVRKSAVGFAAIIAYAAMVASPAAADTDDSPFGKFVFRCENAQATDVSSREVEYYNEKANRHFKRKVPVYNVIAAKCEPATSTTPRSGKMGKGTIVAKHGDKFKNGSSVKRYGDSIWVVCNRLDAGDGSGIVTGADC